MTTREEQVASQSRTAEPSLDLSDPEQRRQRYKQYLEAFVLRARRVREHSLLKEPERMTALAKAEWKMTVDTEGSGEMVIDLPEEERMESLAARVRPVLLNDEWVHHGKALNAIGVLVDALPESAVEHRRYLKSEWKRFDDKSVEISGYSIQTRKPGVPDGEATDTALAWAWFYGDVVHASPERLALTEGIDIFEKYMAACTLVARITWLTVSTLEFIEALAGAGLLDLDSNLIERDVVVSEPRRVMKVAIYSAPLGTDPPVNLDAPFDRDWTRFNPGELSDS